MLLAGKTYVVRGEVTNATDGIEVKGTEASPTRLVLCDGAKLKVDGVADKAGIAVGAYGDMTNALIICGQAEGTGALEATGGSQGAGIGGGWSGAGGAVTIMAGKVTAKGSDGGETVGHGDGSSDSGKVMISSGLFGMTVQESWLAEGRAIFGNPDSATRAAYPYLVMTALTVTLGNLENMTAWWTCEDGSVTNVVDGEKFDVAAGTKNVKVIFTPDYCYRFVSDSETGVRELASPLTADCEVLSPEVELIPGSEKDHWVAGDDVTAYTNGTGVLIIEGTGAMNDFASAAEVPWAEAADKVMAVTIAAGVTHVGKNALAGFVDTVTVNGTPLSFYDMMAGARGLSEPIPSGAISGAEFDAVQIIDGKAYLDVSVYTSDTLTNQNWSVATNGVIEVPAEGKQGFFYLMSKPAVPADKGGVPFQPIPRLMSVK